MKFRLNKELIERLPETLQIIIAVVLIVAIAFLMFLGYSLED